MRDGVVVKQEPDPDELFHNRPCLRGYSQIQRMYHPNRIKYPLKRVEGTERGAGEWERISWEQAISEITAKWSECMEQFGPQSICLYPGTSNGGLVNGIAIALSKRLWNLAGMSVFDICVDLGALTGVDRVCGGSGFETPANQADDDLKYTKYLVNFSANSTESGIFRWRDVLDERARGMQYIVVDPNQTTAAARADKWIQIRPASDGALILGIINVILSEGWENTDFISQNTTAPYLVKADGTFLRASDFGTKPVDMGIDPMTGQPILYDAPMVMGANGKLGADTETPDRLIHGTFDTPAGKVTCAFDLFCERIAEYDLDKVTALTDVSAEDIRYLAEVYVDTPTKTELGMGGQAFNNGHSIGTALGCLLAITGNLSKPGAGMYGQASSLPLNYQYMMPNWTMGPTIPFLEFDHMLETGLYPGTDQPFPVKCVYSVGAMYGGGIDANWVKESIIDKLDLLVVTDTSMCDTARFADYVLPAAHYFEFEDVLSNPVRQAFLHSQKCVEPPYECKRDGEIISMLAHGLGFGDYFQGTTEDYLHEAMAYVWDAGITLDLLREVHGIPMPADPVYHPDHVYSTPTGKLEIYCENPVPRMQTNMPFNPEEERLPYWFPPNEGWSELEIMEKYPLILTSERSRDRHHTNGFELPWLLEALPEPTVKMNPVDAEARGVCDGDYVELFNDRGNAVARAVVNPGIRPGMLVYPKGWQKSQFKDGSFSDLSNHLFNANAVNSSFMDTAVELRLWEGEE